MELIIIDENGWSKNVRIQKAITRIGSAPSNDIQLVSPNISPVHLQVLYSPDQSSTSQITNLSSDISIRMDAEDYILPSYRTIIIRDGVEVLLGNYRIIPKPPLAAGTVQTARQIAASLSFPDPVLRPGYPAAGQLRITNQGDQADCQFDVVMGGFPEDCFQIDPVPLMYPGAQEEVQVKLFHRRQHPQAGSHTLVFSISAPEHYPGEELIIQQEVVVLPVYEHSLKVIDDVVDSTPKGEAQAAVEGRESYSPEEITAPKVTTTSPVIFKPQPNRMGSTTPVKAGENSPKESVPPRDLSKLKVVKNQFDEFWDEE